MRFQKHYWELLMTELVYFLIIFGLCILIYFMTKEIYKLSKHKGIYHFRNIFLYFALAYAFRIIYIAIAIYLRSEGISFSLLTPIALLLISYTSTMAILSMIMAALKNHKVKEIFLHVVSIILSIFIFFTQSQQFLVFIQLLLFIVAVVLVISKKNQISTNKITYGLLFLFWVVNTFFIGLNLGGIFRIPLYFISVVIFFSIYVRVLKRLPDGKKRSS
ncbi:MAG: hypothetical protein ACMXYG_04070 [Candidatus Woesearchaeota archaeon]